MDVNYVGENLLPGQIGQFFVVLSFGAALFSFLSYFFSSKNPDEKSWKTMGRIGFALNALSIAVIGGTLFYIIYNHLFEYHYAYAHSSTKLPTHYIISAFWEGQEGSFWLWMFWQAVLGTVLVFKAKTWESPVMTFVMLCQIFLASMLLGVEVFGSRIGSSPFILLRDALNFPFLKNANYLSMIPDGRGLNPLLQNYWMVIHPPTLFLGFASMIVPFAYAASGLWLKRFKDWINPGLPWALFAVMILGAGIIMGSFWAYEALNFGGFWAWDPVENVSIIPWLTLIAAVHVMVAFKNTGHAYFTAAFLCLISFVLVIYASYLTRSGILGETSVHSFTSLGMSGQLILFNITFLAIMIAVLIFRKKEMPTTQKEEDIYSREFWLFIGALVLTVACVQMIATTSIPVFNALFGTKVAPPIDPIPHYNKWQGAFAVVVMTLTAFTQFLKYKRSEPKKFWASTLASLIIAIILSGAVVYFTKVYGNIMYILITFSAIFAILANLQILADSFKGKWRLAGSAVSHIGFGLLLIGALIAAATNEVISVNNSNYIAVAGFDQVEKPGENLFLTEGEPVQMGEYKITYVGDSVAAPNVFYKINYQRIDEETGQVKESFVLKPFAQNNPQMGGLIGTPGTKHFLTHDIYTLITAAASDSQASVNKNEGDTEHSSFEEYEEPATYEVNIGDTLRYRNGYYIIEGLNKNATVSKIPKAEGDVLVGMKIRVVASDGKEYQAEPVFMIKGGNTMDFHKDVADQGLRFRFSNIMPDKNKLELIAYQKPLPEKKWVVFKAIKFPYINFFWCGTIVMTIGFCMAIYRRLKDSKISKTKTV
ncbi:cytochrome C biogenesis protein [Sphingobacterium sp. DK4209]|uniref:Cytochrome C biogenesis protein n=1 Tax=Sphingobacterium zhuxiongii TaxID=2662364 RepID=A0A5Q0QD72_9SPHI|nr:MULTISPECIES: cytochrome c biogenesis protein CcsA [unclassified Sphingobacterium]MVZ65393.1 cytochrome C biogenesis protein [Sphingobacterium sp. DK4209]QGA27453.1 cytochrome C biogenesis protein [Sphingobacterium sp. dk4302]